MENNKNNNNNFNEVDKNANLIQACEKNQIEVASLLIEQGADVNAINGNNDTPLIIALHNRFNDMVLLLINHNAEVNAKNKNNETPLLLASKTGHMDNISLLIQHGAELNTKDQFGNCPLIYACHYGYHDTTPMEIISNPNFNRSVQLKKYLNQLPENIANISFLYRIIKIERSEINEELNNNPEEVDEVDGLIQVLNDFESYLNNKIIKAILQRTNEKINNMFFHHKYQHGIMYFL